MLNNFTYGDRLILSREIGISEDSPDLEKFAEYVTGKDEEIEKLENKIYDLESEIIELKQDIQDKDDTIQDLIDELKGD